MNNPSLVMITELWLNDGIPDSAVGIGRKFQVHRRDRPYPGGGIYCKPTSKIVHKPRALQTLKMCTKKFYGSL